MNSQKNSIQSSLILFSDIESLLKRNLQKQAVIIV